MVLHFGDCLVVARIILLLFVIITCGFYYVLHYGSGLGHTYVPQRSYNLNFSQGTNGFVGVQTFTTTNLVQEQQTEYDTQSSTSSDPTVQISNSTRNVPEYLPTNESAQFNVSSEKSMNIQSLTDDSFEGSSAGLPSGSSEQFCDMTRFTSWRQGVVTQMKPIIRRNCKKIAANDKKEIDRVKRRSLKHWKNEESDAQFVLRMSNCSNVMEEFSNNFYVSPEERKFPLAFILVVYKNARQVVRLLKAIYRPHNLYCIHPDARQGEDFARVFHQISKCLDNVFVASKVEQVYYMHHSILDAQLNCVEDLLKYDQSRWRYVINLVGRELPLQTNRDIIKLLKRASNVSIVDSHPIENLLFDERFQFKWTVNTETGKVYRTGQKLSSIPHAIKIYKGSTHFALTWQFAHFLFTNQKAIDFRQYLNDVWIPEEEFYASLYHIPEAEQHGGYSENVTLPVSYLEVSVWLFETNLPRTKKLRRLATAELCSGLNVHAVCIVGTGDLNRVYKFGVRENRLFFNKYFMEVDHVIMDCIEERLVQQNELEYAQDVGCSLP